MKNTKLSILMIATLFAACTADDPFSDTEYTTSPEGTVVEVPTSGTAASAVSSTDLSTFSVAIDKTTAEPTTTVAAYYPDAEDDIANNTFETQVNIVFNGTTATYEAASGVTITTNGSHVVANHGDTKGVCYVVSGQTANGSLTIVGEKKYEVLLSSATITNADSTALNLLSKKRAYVVLDGTNSLADGTASKASDQKAALYCKGKLLFSGSGSLSVYGNYNNAIHSADYIVVGSGTKIYATSTANHGIKANDGIYINGGILNVEVSAAGAKGINCESNIQINGGRTTVIATGGGVYEDGEAKGAAAVKCDSTFTMNGGELCLKATGSGGKALKADWEAYINGGTILAITEGSQYRYSNDTASPKGMKIGTKGEHGLLNISGGTVKVRTGGSNGEGIESKGTLTVSGGVVQVSAYDDAINSAGDMYIMGGSIVAVGRSNDGIDSNSNMYITGGNTVALGAGGAESGVDTSEQSRLYITGGEVFGIGGRVDATYAATTDAQAYAQTSGSVSANQTVTVASGSTVLGTFIMPPYSTSGNILVSATGMTSGNSYTLTLGSQTKSVSATTSGSSGGMGGTPGGRH